MKNQEIKDLSTQDLMDKLAAEKVDPKAFVTVYAVNEIRYQPKI